LIFKRPFGTAGGNAVNISESGYRLVSKVLLSTFLTEAKVGVGISHTKTLPKLMPFESVIFKEQRETRNRYFPHVARNRIRRGIDPSLGD